MEQTLTCGCKIISVDMDPSRGATTHVDTFTLPCEGHRIKNPTEGSG